MKQPRKSVRTKAINPPPTLMVMGGLVSLRPQSVRVLFDCYGQYHYDTKTIDYRTNLRGELLRDTILHEVMHAIIDHDDTTLTTEEDYVCSLATGLTRVLQNNPAFARWLTTF